MVPTLIIGAGPFGLSLAAHLKHIGADHLVVGKPMEFWKKNMPDGMYLRSDLSWHLDADEIYTMKAFIYSEGISMNSAEPVSLEFYLNYTKWFTEQTKPNIHEAYVRKLTKIDGGFVAELDDNSIIEAKNVVIAIGMQYFINQPVELIKLLPTGRYSHTCETIDFNKFNNKRILIIGGRQSAFEWAALLNEKNTAHIHISYRHSTPEFKAANWSWVEDIVNNMNDTPAWFSKLSEEEKEAYRIRLWSEGRLKIEPWLEKRINSKNITLHPKTNIVKTEKGNDHSISILLSDDSSFEVDHIILATGYKVDMDKMSFIDASLLKSIQHANGIPILDSHFQSNLTGLYFTGINASFSFGPFFGFTIGARAAAKLIGERLIIK